MSMFAIMSALALGAALFERRPAPPRRRKHSIIEVVEY